MNRFRKLEEVLFFIALHIYMADMYLEMSVFNITWNRRILQLIKYSVLLVLVVKWILCEKWHFKKVLVWGIVFSLCLVLMVVGHYTSLLMAMAMVLSARDIPFRKILKHVLAAEIIWILLIMLCCFAGLLPDLTFSHEESFAGKLAHTFGFQYYSNWGDCVLAMIMIWCYLRGRKCTWGELVLLLLLNHGLYYFHTVSLTYYGAYAYLFAFVLIVKTGWLRLDGKVWRALCVSVPWVLTALTLTLVKLYQLKTLRIPAGRLSTIRSRFEYTLQAIRTYGFSLFGHDIVQYGNSDLNYRGAASGFFLDSGYMYILLAYGTVFACVLLYLYSLLYLHLWKQGEDLLIAWLTIFMFMNIVNNFFIDIPNNPLLFLMADSLAYSGKLRFPEIGQALVRRRHARYSLLKKG